MIKLDEFLKLPTKEIAHLVRASGSKVCVFPINGTRRWYVLEKGGDEMQSEPVNDYLEAAITQQLVVCEMLFDHGIDTLLTPVLGPDLMDRGDEYAQRIGIEGLKRAATSPQFLAFYEKKNVHVRFYGDYKHYLQGTSYSPVCDLLDDVMEKTKQNHGCRLFFGVFAHDSTETISRLSVDYYKSNGKIPTRKNLIQQYYGEEVAKVDFFIGFDKFSVFDMPLISNGEEDLYFSVSPSLYMNEKQLRSILYDHLYTRRTPEIEYSTLDPTTLKWFKDYYLSHQDVALGVGMLKSEIWLPSLFENSGLE